MTPSDQKKALLLIGVMALAVGLVGGYLFVFDPIMKNRAAEATLQGEIAELQEKAAQQDAKGKKLKVQQAQSLPIDQTIAKQEYFVAIEHLVERAIRAAEDAGVPRGEMKATINAKVVDNTARGVPELAKGKPMYTKLAYTVVVRKADMWAVRDILKAYYDLNLLHQITHLSLKKDDDNSKGPVKRNDLTFEFTTEAIIVEGPVNGAQYRRTLIAVPSAFGAAGGGALQQVLEGSTETGRGASARPAQPVLAERPRDYSLIVLKDPFNGPLPPPPPFKLSPVKDQVVKQDDAKAATVKLAVSGEGALGTKFRAIVSGVLFPEGELKVDNKWQTIELPKTSASEGAAKVEVIATSADGKVARTTFNVSVEKKPIEIAKPDTRDDVSGAIILTLLTIRHEDGTASATIRDAANRQRYEIEIERKKVTVAKFWFIKDKKKEDEVDKTGVLLISDDNSRTKRTFKVVGVDGTGLILEDLKPDADAAPKTEAPRPRGPGGPGAPRGGGGPPKQGPANPAAAVGGNLAVGAGVTAGAPKLYRWTVGQSLADVEKEGALTEKEAKKALQQAADNGPMLDVAANNQNLTN